MQTSRQIKDAVKEAYGKIAKQAVPKAQKGCSCCSPSGLREEYAQLEGHYGDADLNLGCGIPTQYAQIKEGDVVLDLGSGAGNDVFVARELVGKTGRVSSERLMLSAIEVPAPPETETTAIRGPEGSG